MGVVRALGMAVVERSDLCLGVHGGAAPRFSAATTTGLVTSLFHLNLAGLDPLLPQVLFEGLIVKWKWSNVPIPVQHLLGLVLG